MSCFEVCNLLLRFSVSLLCYSIDCVDCSFLSSLVKGVLCIMYLY